ncbi:MAG: FAD:protein FMN transferase [Verrucomicrobiota bacterium]
MGTLGSVSLSASEANRMGEATAIVTNVLSNLEKRCSVYRLESELSRLNAQGANRPLPVSRELREILALAKAYGDLSGGAFDVTIGPIMKLWGFNQNRIPANPLTPDQIRPFLDKIGYRHIVLSNDTVCLDQADIQVDLGGIVKGYAVDRCCAELLNRGLSNALVNFGGNMRALGAPAKDRAWKIAVRNPFRPDQSLGTLCLSNGQAVATSGNYERFVTLHGRRYGHIMDPRTGFPASGMAGVTVLAQTAADADALSTMLFVQGTREGLVTLKKKPGCAALFVPDQQPLEILITPRFAGWFSPNPDLADRVILLNE